MTSRHPPARAVPRAPRGRLAAAALAVALAATLGVSGCSEDPSSVAAQAKKGDHKGYVSGDGSVQQVAADRRAAPLSLRGTTLDGRTWSLADEKGTVVVVNVWGSWCGPCVAEAPTLQRVWAHYEKAGKPVQFMGIDFREDAARGAAFARKTGLTYPSLTDEDGLLILDLQGKAPTVPTTLVLDRRGRIAAWVSGEVQESTLIGLVDDTLAEP